MPLSWNEINPDINIEAAGKMADLFNAFKNSGYEEHQLKIYLVRIMFCLFADDTGIFEHKQFLTYILQKTNEDGSDLAAHLGLIFEILDTSKERRVLNIDI